MNFVNLTPHDIVVETPHGRAIIPASGTVARLTPREEVAGMVDVPGCSGDIIGVPLVARTFGEPVGLPDPAPDTMYIVSALVLEAVGTSRPDVVAPDTGPTAIRDEQGRILAVTRFVTAR